MRSIACVWAFTLTFAACAAAQSAAPVAATFPAFSAISSITTLDNHDAVSSTECCSLMEYDSAGRRRTAHIDQANFNAPVRIASISDPVALKLIAIDYTARRATVTNLPAGAARRMVRSDKPFPSDEPDRSDLGAKTVAGVEVHGYGWTTKAADSGVAGPAADKSAQFNPSANPVVNEWWWSPELRIFPLIAKRDANGNKWIQTYEKIELKEPNPGTFSIPAGFQVTTAAVRPDTR